MRRICISLVTLAAAVLSIRAGQTNSVPVFNWGKPVFGVQIADEFANPEVKAGTLQSLCLKIKNSSTNAINLNVAMYPPPAMLTNNFGKKYELQEIQNGFDGSMSYWKLQPAETKEGCVSVFIGKDVQPGDYILVTHPREITIAGGKVCTLVPGVQTVHVK